MSKSAKNTAVEMIAVEVKKLIVDAEPAEARIDDIRHTVKEALKGFEVTKK